MPQLFSRTDDTNWLTPSIADLLEQGSSPPVNDGALRQQVQQLQQMLTDAGTPVRIINVQVSPAYTLFIVQPETQGRLGNRRAPTPPEIRRNLNNITEQRPEWIFGFVPQMRDSQDTSGILLRTPEHSPTTLRRLMVRSQFRNHPSTLAMIFGTTITQELVIRDLDTAGHILLTSADKARDFFLRGLLLTLTLLNTPSELRLALIGTPDGVIARLGNLPHVVGRLLNTPAESQRLFDGLFNEIRRRQKLLDEAGTTTLAEYNHTLRAKNAPALPRILMATDVFSENDWQTDSQQWTPPVFNILSKGAPLGIHLLAATRHPGDLPARLEAQIPTRIMQRQAAAALLDKVPDFPKALLRFLDTFIVETIQDEARITPVESFVVTDKEVENVLLYWDQASKIRQQESGNVAASAPTGVTGYLDPDKLPAEKRAAPPAVAAEGIAEGNIGHQQLATQGAVLAAYLGWISIGALRDVLALSEEEAQAILALLQYQGVVETGHASVLRFVRLADNPLQPSE